MSSGQAALVAKKGMEMLLSAAKGGVNVVATGISKARQHYKDHHEKDVIENLRKGGIPPAELLYGVLQRLYFLVMAGYKREVAAAVQQAAKRMVDQEKSSIPLNQVLHMGDAMMEVALGYSDFRSPGLTKYISDVISGGVGKDHADRDGFAHDLYYAVLMVTESCGGSVPLAEGIFRSCARRMVEEQSGPVPPYTQHQSSLHNHGLRGAAAEGPSASRPPSAAAYNRGEDPFLPSAPPLPEGTTNSHRNSAAVTPASEPDAAPWLKSNKLKAAQGLFILASTIKKSADEEEAKRQKMLRDAEALLKAEQARASGTAPATHANSMR